MDLDYVRLLVDKFDDCFIFYRDIIGLRPTWGDLGYNYASFESGPVKLSIFKRSDHFGSLGMELPPGPQKGERVLVVFRSENVDEEVKALKIRGAMLFREPKDYENWGIRAAYLRDPDDNLIEINTPMPQEKWSDVLKDEDERFRT